MSDIEQDIRLETLENASAQHENRISTNEQTLANHTARILTLEEADAVPRTEFEQVSAQFTSDIEELQTHPKRAETAANAAAQSASSAAVSAVEAKNYRDSAALDAISASESSVIAQQARAAVEEALGISTTRQTLFAYSVDGISAWHTTPTINDYYMRLSTDDGASWSEPIRIRGEKGDQGTPGVAGLPGLDGKDGTDGVAVQSFFHIAFANSPDGSVDFNQDEGEYIGTYVDTIEGDSPNYLDYTWRRIRGIQGDKGDQGIPGVNGATGETSYLHVAYADDILGNGFSQSPIGKLYVGMYTDFTLLDSTDPGLYTWSLLKGASGNYADMRFQQSATEPGVDQVPAPNGWSDAPPPNPTNAVWMIKATKDATGALVTNWSTPIRITGTNGGADGASVEVEYSVNGATAWHTTYTVGDIFMRQRVGGGSWSDPIKFVGEDGQDGQDGADGIPGLKGDQGIPGQSSYFHVAFANSADGSLGFNQVDGDYIGTYVDNVQTDSENYQDYTWRLFKGADGADGIPGTNGANGQTTYLHIAYADTATGSGFNQSPSGKLYIGMYTDFTVADSTDPTKYTWARFKGDDATYVDIIFKESATVLTTAPTGANPSGWSDGPPSGATNPIYMSKATKNGDGTLATTWSIPVKITGDNGLSVETQYSINGSTNWHTTYTSGDKYMRQRIGTGSWSIAMKFIGENGATGPAGPEGPEGPEGPAGSTGATGQRGAGRFQIGTSTGAWSDSTAASACTGGVAVTNDVVTIFKTSDPAVQTTKYYTGSSWSNFELHVHGSALVDGTLNASAIIAHTTIQSPRIEFIGSTHMRIQAAQGFGSSNQFIEWFGPISLTGGVPNMANVTEARAITYIKTNGDAYFGGSLSAGILRTSVQNPSTGFHAVNSVPVTLGPFGTNGKAKQVVISWSITGYYGSAGSCAVYNTPTFGFRLERSLNNGSSWTSVGTGTINGSIDPNYEAENNYCYVWLGGGGSITITDNNTSTSNFMYRLVVTNYVPGLNNSLVSSQSISVVSTEE